MKKTLNLKRIEAKIKAIEKTKLGLSFAIIFLVLFLSYFGTFNYSADGIEKERFIVSKQETNTQIVGRLKEDGFVTRDYVFNIALWWINGGQEIEPGAYRISKPMSDWQVARALSGGAYMKWVTIQEGLRKEEIAEVLQRELGWSNSKKKTWITSDTSVSKDYFEGVYFPDTYLIPKDETGLEVAKRLQSKFEEKFADLSKEAIKQNIKWTTVVTMASIIQREAAGKRDMPLIAGIIWNRLNEGRRLEIDATVQYGRGDTGKGWWAQMTPEDREKDSPFNTYKNEGLPPSPICSPGLDAMKAVLYPQKTSCMFYIHDNDGQIHCSKDYGGHLYNIKKYL